MFSTKKMVQGHQPSLCRVPPIPLFKETWTDKSDGGYVELKLRKDPMYSMLDPYEFIMSLFEPGNTEKFLFCWEL